MESTNQSQTEKIISAENQLNQNIDSSAILRLKHEKLFMQGIVWIGVGITTMLLSFIMIFCFSDADKIMLTFMYLITTVSAMSILKGLVNILGF